MLILNVQISYFYIYTVPIFNEGEIAVIQKEFTYNEEV